MIDSTLSDSTLSSSFTWLISGEFSYIVFLWNRRANLFFFLALCDEILGGMLSSSSCDMQQESCSGGMLRKSCRNVAKILQECCGNPAGMLRKFCRNAAEVLQECCGNSARMLRKSCRNEVVAEILQVCCRNSACVLMKYCVNAADMLRTFWRNPAKIQSGVCQRKKIGV